MKEFLKDNSALVAAIVLPLVLVCIFAASTLFINVTVEDPKNSFFVATNYNYAQSSSFTFDVVEEKLVVTYRAEQKDANGYYTNNNVPRLWRVNIPEQTVEEIALPVPANKKTTTLTIPGVTDIAVKNIQPGPDGYTFSSTYRYDGSFMTEVFSPGRSRSNVALFKDGRAVSIKVPGEDWNYNSTFIGWIVKAP